MMNFVAQVTSSFGDGRAEQTQHKDTIHAIIDSGLNS